MRRPSDFDKPFPQSNPGCRTKDVLKPTVRPNGTVSLECIGHIDVQEEINSYLPDCDLNVILRKLATGQAPEIADRQPIFDDFTGYPKSPLDALNYVNELRYRFSSLPDDVRAKFDYDFNKFVSSATFRTAADDLSEKQASPVSPAPVSPDSDNNPITGGDL